MTISGDAALPLCAAIFYTLATLFLKRGLSFGMGAFRIAFLSNIFIFFFYLPILNWDSEIVDSSYAWAALVCGAVNFSSMALTYVIIRVGDISIQTPVLGSKVIFVAVLSVIMGVTPMTGPLWIGAILSVLAIYVLSKPDSLHATRKRVIFITVSLSLLTALGFAVNNVFIEKYAPLFGEGPFLVLLELFTALFSFILIPFFEGSIFKIPRRAWGWIGAGLVFMALESISLNASFAFFGNATAANILYSSRGIWSIIFVWSLGHLFVNDESKVGAKVMARRLLGACMLFGAIILVLATD